MAKTINVDMNDFEITEDHKHIYNCKGATNIDVIYDSEIEDCFDNVSYSGSTVSINVCGLEKFIFTNVKDTGKVNFKVTRSEGALQPGQVQFNGTVGEFLNAFDVPPIDDRSSTINIDMNYGMTANVMNYNCKGVNKIDVTFDSEIEDMYVIRKSGSTVSLNVTNAYKYNFNNISSLDDIEFKVTRSAGALQPGQVQFDGTMKELCDAFETWLPEKGTKVDGSVFDDNIAFNGYEGTKGLTINGKAGDDDITGTEFNDTITGGEGVNTINLFTQKKFGDDVVVLTKGEHLTLKIADLNVLNGYNKYAKVYLNGDNLVVDVYDRDVSATTEGAVKQGSVTIKNYAKKDVLTVTGDLFLTDNNDDSNVRDLRAFQKIVQMDSNHYTKANYTGGWLDDAVDATNFKVYKKGQEVTKNTEGYEKVKGVTVNTGGAVNSNFARGSIYADTLNGGADDDRLWGAEGNDKLVGGAGNDTIVGGIGNDTLTGGKDNDTFTFRKINSGTTANAGIDTITDAAKGDIIRITDVAKDDLVYVKNGNDLDIYYDNTNDQNNKIIVKNHFKTKEGNRIEVLRDKNGTDVDLATVDLVISGKGKINGTDNAEIILGSDKADTIKALGGDDTINAGAGNDKIYGDAGDDLIAAGDGNDNVYGGAGDDLINAGSGKNNIYYSLGDGDDTILYGGVDAHDTLVFDKGITVTADYDGDDIVVTYSGTKGGVDYENTVTLLDGKNDTSVEYIKIGGKSKSLDDYLGGDDPDAKVYHITANDEGKTYNLTKGNNRVVFDNAPILSAYEEVGCNTINSANVAGDGNTDTLDMSGKNQQGEGLSFMNNTVLIMDADNNGNGLWVDATVYQDCPGDGSFLYNNFYSTTAPNVVIKDADRSYNAKGYATAQTLNLANDTTDRLVAINAETGTNNITSNSNHNIIFTTGGAQLNYTYAGGQDNVTEFDWQTNDTYNVALTNNTAVIITDNGFFDDDTLNVTGNLNNTRILFDVYKTISNELVQYEANTGHYVMTDVSNLSADVLATSTELHPVQLTEGIHVNGLMETVTMNGEAVDMDDWSSAIASDVGAWLSTNNYNSVYDAFYGENPCTDETQINALVQCYNVAYGS